MNNEDIIREIEKLKYKVQVLSQAVDYEKHPVEALILENDWNRGDINRVHDIFEKWEKKLDAGTKMSSFDFENDFERELGVSYQGLKSIILSFYRNGQWTNVCEAYVDSFEGAPSMEYHSIMRRER